MITLSHSVNSSFQSWSLSGQCWSSCILITSLFHKVHSFSDMYSWTDSLTLQPKYSRPEFSFAGSKSSICKLLSWVLYLLTYDKDFKIASSREQLVLWLLLNEVSSNRWLSMSKKIVPCDVTKVSETHPATIELEIGFSAMEGVFSVLGPEWCPGAICDDVATCW